MHVTALILHYMDSLLFMCNGKSDVHILYQLFQQALLEIDIQINYEG